MLTRQDLNEKTGVFAGGGTAVEGEGWSRIIQELGEWGDHAGSQHLRRLRTKIRVPFSKKSTKTNGLSFSEETRDGGGAVEVSYTDVKGALHQGVGNRNLHTYFLIQKNRLSTERAPSSFFQSHTTAAIRPLTLISLLSRKGRLSYLAEPPVRVVGLVDDHHLAVFDPEQTLLLVS